MTVDYRKNGVAGDAVQYAQYQGSERSRPISVVPDVNLMAVVQDNARYVKDGETKMVYVQFLVHPDDPTAKGQQSLNLMEHVGSYAGKPRTNYTIGLTPDQFDSLVTASGDNQIAKLDRDGKVSGKVYGVKGSVFQKSSKDPDTGKIDRSKPYGFMPIPKTFAASDLPIAAKTKTGKDAVTRAYEVTAANRAAAKAEAEAAKQVEVQAEAEQPALV